MLWTYLRNYAAEYLGTLALTLVVIVTIVSSHPALTPALAALTLGFFVYTIGPLSGCHINPVITLAICSLRKIRPTDALFYIGSQFLGAVSAFFISYFLITDLPAKLAVQAAPSSRLIIGIGEGMGTLFFAFGIAAIVHKKIPEQMNGVVAALSLLIGIYIASTVSNGVLNPAVALGILSFNVTYLLGPVVGAIAGMQLYHFLMKGSD